MSFTYLVKGKIQVIIFSYALHFYVLLPEDFEDKRFVIQSKNDLLNELREMYGREIKDLSFVTEYYH